tara:strand:+ start:1239 stop:1604 length:366 start_codon:yes stop_codon:yes gene_type:complete
MWLALLKNPLTKIVLNKATEHFKHKAIKVKTIREAEIEACKEVDVQRIKSQDKSFKDEILLIWLVGMLTTGFFESTRDNFRAWVEIINDLPDSVWYLLIIVFTATFSTKMTDKVLNRNKKK